MKNLLIALFLLLSLTTNAQHCIYVKHKYYVIEYDTTIKSPLISFYIQTKEHSTKSIKLDRKLFASFHKDPLINLKYQCASNNEYSSYNSLHRTDGLRKDKGHLSPYTAFDFDTTAAEESMYYTNTAPQASFLNEHPWERIEQYILKTLSPKYDTILVWTGCLYGNSRMNDVPIPDYYWKVIEYNGKQEAWLAKNEPTDNTDYTKYSIDTEELKKIILKYYPKLNVNFVKPL